jgi:hypothetical protein
MDWISLGNFLLDLTKEITSAYRNRDKSSLKGVEIDSLVELYRITKHLPFLCDDLSVIERWGDNEGLSEQFCDESLKFVSLLVDIDVRILDIYYPSLVGIIRFVFWHEFMLGTFHDHIEKKFKKEHHKKIKSIIGQLSQLGLLHWLYVGGTLPSVDSFLSNSSMIPKEELEKLKRALEQCNCELGELVRENWKFRDLADKK